MHDVMSHDPIQGQYLMVLKGGNSLCLKILSSAI